VNESVPRVPRTRREARLDKIENYGNPLYWSGILVSNYDLGWLATRSVIEPLPRRQKPVNLPI